jgi:hypothetical protein
MMRLLRRKNKSALYFACIVAILVEVLALIFWQPEMHICVKYLLIGDLIYSTVMLVGNIITAIQDKQLEKEIIRLGEHIDR